MGGLVTVSSSNPLPVGGKSVQKSASFTRPADTTAYAANDAIADSTSEPTFGVLLTVQMQTEGRATLSKHGY